MKIDELLNMIREEFEKIISNKTGWGKNEIMQAYDKACAFALAKFTAKYFPGEVT